MFKKSAFYFLIFFIVILFNSTSYAQYANGYVSMQTDHINGSKITLLNMSGKGGRIKVKYFAYKDGGTSVYQRFLNWKINKNIICYSSGAYIDFCDAIIAKPAAFCIDNGNVINNLLSNELDGLIVIYPGGDMQAYSLKEGAINIVYKDGTKKKVNLKNALEKQFFIDWAKKTGITTFQTHLLCYKNQLAVSDVSKKTSNRRFIVVGKDAKGNNQQMVVNSLSQLTLYAATTNIISYLTANHYYSTISFIFNLDPGCQDVYRVYNPDGRICTLSGFNGSFQIEKAANLIVYYYE